MKNSKNATFFGEKTSKSVKTWKISQQIKKWSHKKVSYDFFHPQVFGELDFEYKIVDFQYDSIFLKKNDFFWYKIDKSFKNRRFTNRQKFSYPVMKDN